MYYVAAGLSTADDNEDHSGDDHQGEGDDGDDGEDDDDDVTMTLLMMFLIPKLSALWYLGTFLIKGIGGFYPSAVANSHRVIPYPF